MARVYTESEIDTIFERIWIDWPNKIRASAAKKALAVSLRQGEDPRGIELACRIYALESLGDSVHYHFNNFLLEDHWKDYLGGSKNPQEYYAKLEANQKLAIEIIEAWNEACRPHWCQSLDTINRIPIVTTALKDDFFRKNWKKALDKARNIFKYKAREGEPRAKLILTLRWFCNVSADKHTVLKIEEGEYGVAEVESTPSYTRPPEPKELTEEDQEDIKSMFKEVFGRELTSKKNHERKPEIPREEISDEDLDCFFQ